MYLGIPYLCRSSGMDRGSRTAQFAMGCRAEKIGFQFDGREAFGAVRQMSNRRVAGTSVGQSDDRCRVQKAVRCQHLRADNQSPGEFARVETEHFDSEPIWQEARSARVERFNADPGTQNVTAGITHRRQSDR